MTQRLSTSATFRLLQTRVQTLEQINPLPATLANNSFLRATTTAGSITRILGVSAGDTLYLGAIDASVSSLLITNGGSTLLQFDSWANASFVGSVIAPSFNCAVAAGVGAVRVSRSYAAGFTGILEFAKADGSRNGYVGFNPEAGAMQYGSDTGAGHAFTGGDVAVSANIVLPNAGYLKAKKVDGTATRIMGITGADTLCIGGVDATIGNVVMEVAATPVISLTASAITLLNDANLGFTMSGGNPRITFDANDLLFYDRTANKFYFVIGGINVASIDASGNMRLKGTLTQSVTP